MNDPPKVVHCSTVEAIGDANQDFKVLTSTKISISELLDIVNEVHSDILPKTVAEHYGNERKKTKLRENVRFSLSAPVNKIPLEQRVSGDALLG